VLCSDRLSTYFLVGGILVGQALRCGKWRLFASFGVYEGKETIGALRIWKGPWRRFHPLFTIHCTFGLWLMCTLCHLALMTFLLEFLLLLRCFLCIL
jgi:hypothetical protein